VARPLIRHASSSQWEHPCLFSSEQKFCPCRIPPVYRFNRIKKRNCRRQCEVGGFVRAFIRCVFYIHSHKKPGQCAPAFIEGLWNKKTETINASSHNCHSLLRFYSHICGLPIVARAMCFVRIPRTLRCSRLLKVPQQYSNHFWKVKLILEKSMEPSGLMRK